MAQKRRFHPTKTPQILMGSTDVLPVDVFFSHKGHHLSSSDTRAWWDAMYIGLPDWEFQRDADYQKTLEAFEADFDPVFESHGIDSLDPDADVPF